MILSNIIRNPYMKTLRRAIKKIIPSRVYILKGPLQGNLWLADASSPNVWLGTYEHDKLIMFAQNLKKNDVVFDIGANVGLYTLLASQSVGKGGHVYSFEPLPRNIQFIQKHIALNKATNVEIFDHAISDRDGTIMFEHGYDHAMGYISEKGDITVPTSRLDSILAEKQLHQPDCLKIDVEGAESQVLSGAQMTLEKIRPTIFLAIHGSEQYQKCTEILKSFDYQIDVIEKSSNKHFDLLAEIFASPNP